MAPCHTQQYNIYYRGTCGSYVDEGRLDTDHQEHTFDGLQEGVNYSFTVNQTGFSGGRVLSTGPVYARTFTAGKYNTAMSVVFSKQLNGNFSKQISLYLQKHVCCFNHTVITWLHASLWYPYHSEACNQVTTVCIKQLTMTCILTTGILQPNNFCKKHCSNSTTCSSEPNQQHALCSVCVQNLKLLARN